MKNVSVKIQAFLLFIILFLLTAPAIQQKLDYIKLEPLKGAIHESEKPQFSSKEWLSGDYQLRAEKYLNERFGFRSFFIRLNNQIAFNLFSKAKANSVIVGKNNYLYEENYIKAYYGTDFIGTDSITHRMKRLKFIQDTLQKLNKTLIVVFAAGKGSFYPEYFPKAAVTEKSLTNYEYHIKLANELGLNHIDFNSYFVKNKSTSKYPLYPQYGIHWSYYGSFLAADSIIKYIEKKRAIDMPNLYFKDIELAEAKETDYDIADGMNLLSRLESDKMAYPHIQFQSDSGKIKPSVLVVADSYYWGMFNFGISMAFSASHFWFYNKQIYPDSYQSAIETSQVNLNEQLANHDVFIIMATEATLPALGWGFIEAVEKAFKEGKKNAVSKNGNDAEFQKKVAALRNYIKTDKKWMDHIIKKAADKKISVDSMLTMDAIWEINKSK